MNVTYASIALALAGPGVVALISEMLATDPETLAPCAVSLCLFALLVAGVAAIAVRGERLHPAEIGFRNSGWRSLLWALPLALFFIFLFGPVVYAALPFLGLAAFDARLETLHELPRWYLALAVLVVSAGEEA